MQTTVIYISGLGDRYDPFRTLALRLWKFWGVTAVHVRIAWFDGGTMESKLVRIQAAIGKIAPTQRVVLIGESAGATLALHMATRNPRIAKVITLCGVSRPTTPVSDHLRRRAPALDEAVSTLPVQFDTPIDSVRAALDGVVGARYSSAAGSTRHVVWSVGHIITIAMCLTVYAPIMSVIAKKHKK